MSTQISQFDKMTKTPVSKLVMTLSVPTIISMLVTNIYNIVDSAFVGTLGTSASGAVGIVFGFMTILQAIGFTFGQGAGSIVSRLLGKKEDTNASIIASTGFFCAFILATVTAIICFVFIKPLLYFLGATDTIFPYAKSYISYIIISTPFMVTTFVLNNVLRFEGKASFAMIGLLSGSIINIGGDALLMFVFKMGIRGAAISTCVSQMISFSILFWAFISGKTTSKISLKYFRLDFPKIGDIVGTGLPSMLRQGLNSIATILLNTLSKPFGDAAIAGMSITSRIFFLFFSIVIGVGQGFQPVSGFNYGAGRFDRVRKAFYFTFSLAEALVLVMSTIVFFKAGTFARLLRDDDMVVFIATRALKLQCIASIFLPFCVITEMVLQSTGSKLAASILSSLRGGLFFIPALLILSHYRGLSGIQEAQPLAFVLAVIPAVIMAPLYFKKLKRFEEQTEKGVEIHG